MIITLFYPPASMHLEWAKAHTLNLTSGHSIEETFTV